MPTNADLARWYKDDNLHRPHDFVRRNGNGEVPNGGAGAVELEHLEALYSVDGGFEAVYSEGTLMLPLEGTEDVIVDIDEDNKKINIHLDATVRQKLARMLLSPISNPTEQAYVIIDSSGAQKLISVSKDIDLNGLTKTVNGVNVPDMSVQAANNILNQFIEGEKSMIRWYVGTTDHYLKILNASESDTSGSIRFLLDGEHIVTYSWDFDGTIVNTSVNTIMFE